MGADILRVAARSYCNALYSHMDTSDAGFDKEAFDYVFAQAHFVANYADEVADFLAMHGVLSVDEKHLQYFFAILQLYEPYMRLWRFCFDRMVEEELVGTKAGETFARMLTQTKEHKRLFKTVAANQEDLFPLSRLSARTRNALVRMTTRDDDFLKSRNIEWPFSCKDIFRIGRSHLMDCRNFGEVSANEVDAVLKSLGFNNWVDT